MITVFLVVPTTVETLSRGRSLGKLACGLRTVRDDAGPISFQHAFVRALIGFVEIYAFTGAPAFFSALLSTKGKRLGDHAAGTYVVRERVRLHLAPPALLPPHLARGHARPTWPRCRPGSRSPCGSTSAVPATLDPATARRPRGPARGRGCGRMSLRRRLPAPAARLPGRGDRVSPRARRRPAAREAAMRARLVGER